MGSRTRLTGAILTRVGSRVAVGNAPFLVPLEIFALVDATLFGYWSLSHSMAVLVVAPAWGQRQRLYDGVGAECVAAADSRHLGLRVGFPRGGSDDDDAAVPRLADVVKRLCTRLPAQPTVRSVLGQGKKTR